MFLWVMWLRVWWMQTDSDRECAKRGIPRHLHRGSKPAIQKFRRRERLYRRFPPDYIGENIANAVSFKRKDSSVTRSLFSHPDDARWDAENGQYKAQHAVISFPAHMLNGKTWYSNDGNTHVQITVFHDPLQCNYAHCDLHLFENGIEVPQITKSLRMQIRDILRPMIKKEP